MGRDYLQACFYGCRITDAEWMLKMGEAALTMTDLFENDREAIEFSDEFPDSLYQYVATGRIPFEVDMLDPCDNYGTQYLVIPGTVTYGREDLKEVPENAEETILAFAKKWGLEVEPYQFHDITSSTTSRWFVEKLLAQFAGARYTEDT